MYVSTVRTRHKSKMFQAQYIKLYVSHTHRARLDPYLWDVQHADDPVLHVQSARQPPYPAVREDPQDSEGRCGERGYGLHTQRL